MTSLEARILPLHSIRHLAHQGQAGLVAIAISMVVALVLAATTLSGLSFLNAKRSVVTMQSLQTYYTAQAGIQEAIATRMVPGTNYLGLLGSPNAYYTRTGAVYSDPTNAKGIIGYYRFMVVGGDSARQSNGSYYNITDVNPSSGLPWLLETGTIPPSSPFIVISNGISCVTTTGKRLVATDQFVTGKDQTDPSCNPGYQKDEITLVARVHLLQSDANGNTLKDDIDHLRSYKDKSKLRLPASAFVPGYGWTDTNTDLDFNTIWGYKSSNDTKNPVQLTRVVFYNFLTDKIDVSTDINSPTPPDMGAVPKGDVIRLYFNGPIDYRSIDPGMSQTLATCKSTPGNCRIRVVDSGGAPYAGNTIIPLLPSSTQVILLPPLSNTLNAGTPYQIEVDASKLKSFKNETGTSNYVIKFTAQ